MISETTFVFLTIILFAAIHDGNSFFVKPGHALSLLNGKFQLKTTKKPESKPNQKLPSIPVIGPIPFAPPLNIGVEYLLDNPTPLQWKALQESIIIHKISSSDQVGSINAAPIIAFIDEKTGSSRVFPFHDSKKNGGRYATIAALVGIKIKKQKDRNEQDDDFITFYNNIRDKKTISPRDCSIRIVGVGRASLYRFFYKTPTSEDELDSSSDEDDDNDFDVDEYDDGYEDRTPIMMADFQVVLDDSSYHGDGLINEVGERGSCSPRSSPVHTLNYLHNFALKIYRVHDRRRRLTLGIKAGFYRLQLNAEKRKEIFLDDLDDHDGLGLLFEARRGQGINETLDYVADDDLFSTLTPFNDYGLNETDKLKIIKDVASLDNYGLSLYGSMSKIPDLANVLLRTLEPFYSKDFVSREESELEIASFVAIRCLEGYIDSSNVAWSLLCTSSIQRLNRALELMLDHETKLKLVAAFVNKKLQDCGEECSDLW